MTDSTFSGKPRVGTGAPPRQFMANMTESAAQGCLSTPGQASSACSGPAAADPVRYYHEMPAAEFQRLCESGMTWRGLVDAGWHQPDWCGYPDALDMLGCWSLIGGHVTGEAYCVGCECRKIGEMG